MASIINVDNIRAVGSSTTGITVDSSGRVLFPQIPCACVSLSTSNTQDGTNPYTTIDTDILFDVVAINQGSVYNSSNGRFTAPIAGIYEFSYTYLKDDANSVTYVDVFKNGSLHAGPGGRAYDYAANLYSLASMKLLINLAANDYLTLRLDTGGIHLDSSGFYHSIVFKLVG